MDCFTLENLSFAYEGSTENALKNVSMSFPEGSFTVICGESGSGKSTLLRCLKTSLVPRGRIFGSVLFRGNALSQTDAHTQASKIGFVSQSPEAQTVTDTVCRELAFGLECVGVPSDVIRRRVAAVVGFFGLNDIYRRKTSELSGGQKQLLSLAAVTALSPDVILLDEPTSQLDPLAACSFVEMLAQLNRETGVTVVMAEQRLENVLPFASNVAVLEGGRVVCCAAPSGIAGRLKKSGSAMLAAMPAPVQLFYALGGEGACPVSVADGRAFLKDYTFKHYNIAKNNSAENPKIGDGKDNPCGTLCAENGSGVPHAALTEKKSFSQRGCKDGRAEEAVRAEHCYFRYKKNDGDVIRDFSFSLRKGEFFALLGSNGSGKTTALKLLAGVKKPYFGKIHAFGRIGILPQEPRLLFSKGTVRDEILCASADFGRIPAGDAATKSAEQSDSEVNKIAEMCKITHLLDRDPYDLSGGETLRAALAVVLAGSPDILFLDEPTNGTDSVFKAYLAQILRELRAKGVSVFAVSHDVEFCAEYADRCGLFFDGCVISDGTPKEFFSDGSLYAAAAARMSHGIIENAVTVKDILTALGEKKELSPNSREGGSGEITEQADGRRNEHSAENGEKAASFDEAELLSPDTAANLAEQSSDTHAADGGEMRKKRLSPAKISCGTVFGLLAAVLLVMICVKKDIFSAFPALAALTPTMKSLIKYTALTVLLFGTVLSFNPKKEKNGAVKRVSDNVSRERVRLPKRTVFACAGALLLIPVTVLIGVFLLKNKSSGIISAAVLTECLLPFFIAFEGKKPKAAELAVLATVCAAGVAGRAAFFMLPQFKPVMALAIIVGVSLGAESGFLVGAVTMLVSNIMFSQGPWTPWQMLSMGIIGFLAGLLADGGLLPLRRAPLAVFGGVCAVVIYGGIMNPASVLMYSPQALNLKTLLASYASGVALDVVHGLATAFFLFVAAEPLMKMLRRIKSKYL